MNRRQFLALAAAPAASPGWNAQWDRAVIQAALERQSAAFDEKQGLLARRIGPEYHYHTNLRDTLAHPTRDSLEYALFLLEDGGNDRALRALRILDRVLSLQETDPHSKWYGLWGYYLEEPAPKMSPADWNWADFNGSLLLEIELRHGGRLGAPLRARVREAIRHAAYSVRRRNVAMTYTNIAVQGTFVTLAAAELLGDKDLLGYAVERLQRFARTVDETGSFAEYNSPTYANVTIANLTRIRMFVKRSESLALAGRIHTRAWLHLARHWHAPTRQLAGPMSRCYRTDIGSPLWLQKALNLEEEFVRRDQITGAEGEVGILKYQCPDTAIGPFLSLGTAHEHRELFLTAPAGIRPVQGTTWLEDDFCLGSVNRGNFWVQGRPLLAYWGGDKRPARYLQARFLKDDYDFASALLYSVQERNHLLGAVAFRSPGGDKHPSLDPLPNPFSCSRLRLRFDLAGVPVNAPLLVDGRPAELGEFPPGSRVAVDLGGTRLWIRSIGAACGRRAGRVTVASEDGLLTLSVDLLEGRERREIRWSGQEIAYAQFALAMDAWNDDLAEFDRRQNEPSLGGSVHNGHGRVTWGALGLAAPLHVAPIADQDRTFSETLNGASVPVVRLSDEKLI